MRVALEVSQNHELRDKIRKKNNGEENPLFHDTHLFITVSAGISRRGYLRGKAPPGHTGSSPYTEDEIKTIAKRLYKKGKLMWTSFMQFIKLTTMTHETKKKSPTLEPNQVVAKYEIMGRIVDIEYPLPASGLKHLRVRVGDSWYRVDISKVGQLAKEKGRRIVFSEPECPEPTDPEPTDLELEAPEVEERADPPNDPSGDGATRPPEIEPPAVVSYPLQGNLVSPIGPISPAKEPATPDRTSRESPETGTAHLCANHRKADFTPYPTKNADYDSHPGRCKATSWDGTQCDVTFHLCPDHQISNVRVYPNDDYDNNPGRCKAMTADGKQYDRKDACLAHLCGKHHPLAKCKWYPITNDDYDGRPGRCKAMTGKDKQCESGLKWQDKVAGATRVAARSALPGRTPLCGKHLRANFTLYPSTNRDYDDDPKTCKAIVKSGPNKGKQCSKPRKN